MNKIVKENPELEKTVLATIYKQDGKIFLESNKEDVFAYEIYGFLKCYLEILETDLIEQMEVSFDE
jgi:hypothetical protein